MWGKISGVLSSSPGFLGWFICALHNVPVFDSFTHQFIYCSLLIVWCQCAAFLSNIQGSISKVKLIFSIFDDFQHYSQNINSRLQEKFFFWSQQKAKNESPINYFSSKKEEEEPLKLILIQKRIPIKSLLTELSESYSAKKWVR